MDEKLKRVKKSVSVTAKVLKVVCVLMTVAAIMSSVGAVLCFSLHDKIDPEIAKQVAAQNGTIEFDEIEFGGIFRVDASVQELADKGEYGYAIGAVCIYGAVICVILGIFFKVFRKVFILVEESDTPFNAAIMAKLKKSFIGLVVISAMFIEPGVALVMALVLWCIYCILDYGCVLQKQSDETL